MERYLNLFPAENEKHGVEPSGKPAFWRPVPEAGFNLLTEACICWWSTSKMRVPCATGSPDEIGRTSISISPEDRTLRVHFCQSTLKALQDKMITRDRLGFSQQ